MRDRTSSFLLRAAKILSVVLAFLLLPVPRGFTATASLLPGIREIVPGPGSTVADDGSPACLRLRGDLTKTADRLLWDIPLHGKIPVEARSLLLRYSVVSKHPSARSIAIHLKTPRGWYAYPDPLPLSENGRANMSLSRFQGEGNVEGVPLDAEMLRLSIWKNDTKETSTVSTDLLLTSLSATSSRIAVVQSTAATAGTEAGIATLCASRCEKALARADLSCDIIDDSLEQDDLSGFSVVFLPYSPNLDGPRTRHLLSYLAKGGKLFVFYNPNPPLAARFGLERPVWKGANVSRPWTAFLPSPSFASAGKACPAVPHFTENILPPRPALKSKAEVVATWLSTKGTPTRIPACTLSPHGAWFAHLPPLPFPATALFYRGLLAELAPDLLPGTKAMVESDIPTDLAAASPDEVRAVWLTTPVPSHPDGWEGLFTDWTSGRRITTVFLHCNGLVKGRASSGTADYLKPIRAAGKKHGVAVHGWLTCWTTTGLSSDTRERLGKEGRLLVGSDGRPRDWLCLDHPANRELVRKWAEDLAGRDVDGIHLDYMRYADEGACFCETTRKAFEESIGGQVDAWPEDVLPGGRHQKAFAAFRSASLTSWLADLRVSLRKSHPDMLLSAAVFGSPAGATSVGQDIATWCRKDLVDFLAPMDYTEDLRSFEANLSAYLTIPGVTPSRLVIGIGTGADESQLDAGQTARQIDVVRRKGCLGHAFFQDDVSLREILRSLPAPSPGKPDKRD